MSPIKKGILLLATFLPSSARIVIWRWLGFKVGRRCRVSPMSVVVADKIELGDGAIIEPLTFIYCPRVLSLGERSRIASFVRIIGYGEGHFAKQSFVALGNLIDTWGGFFLGERSQIGPRSTSYSHGETGLIYNMHYPHRTGPIRIGNDCWIGMCCTIYPSVTIGEQTIVYPGQAIKSDVGPRCAIMPPSDSQRSVSLAFLTGRVTDELLFEKMTAALEMFAAIQTGSSLERTSDDFWVLSLPRGQQLVFIRTREPGMIPLELNGASVVIWQLGKCRFPPKAPTFQFESLSISGPRSPFSDEVADFLCTRLAAHFAFDPVSLGVTANVVGQ